MSFAMSLVTEVAPRDMTWSVFPVDRDQASAIIDRALGKIPGLRSGTPFSAAHVEFHQTTGMELARIFGGDSPISLNFSAITYRSNASYLTTAGDFEAQKARRAMGAYQQGLEAAEGILRSAREQLMEHGVDRILSESKIKAEGARAFISHGKETPALGKVERFVRALGLEPRLALPPDHRDSLVRELTAISWAPNGQGKIIIESKADVKVKLHGASPDFADALAIAVTTSGVADFSGVGQPAVL